MAVSRDDVRQVAALARISVAEAQLDALVTELSGILAHMEVLVQVDTTAGAADEPAGMPLAADEPGSVPLARAREEGAPKMRDGFFLVPRLATHHDDGERSA